MIKVIKNDGTWKAKPSGLKKGNLTAWKDMMFEARSEPEIDDIIVDKTTAGETIGYLCTVADGYDSYWKRVAKPHLVQYSSPQQVAIYYTKRAKAAEMSAGFDDDIPF